jgi:hypothetical protein
VLAPLYDSVY